MLSSSERIALEFMAQGTPAPEGLQSTGARPGDQSFSLECKTPRVGGDFKEWATGGYDLCGESKGVKTPDGVDYCREGDWQFDKKVVTTDQDYKTK